MEPSTQERQEHVAKVKINLMLTRRCNQACPYCFAEDAMRTDEGQQDMTFDDGVMCLDRHVQEGGGAVAFLGGEPTLHRDFGKLVQYALDRDLDVVVFSNLLTPKSFDVLTHERVSIVANINPLSTYRASQLTNIRRNLTRYRQRVSLGYNICDLQRDFEGILELYGEIGIARSYLRLGIASPTPGGQNRHIPVSRFSELGEFVVDLARACRSRGITIGYDCGFVPCMFSDEELEELAQLESPARFNCGAPSDISPSLDVFHCFPLSTRRSVHVTEWPTLGEVRMELQRFYDPFRSLGIKKECPTCEHRSNGKCPGGCLGHALVGLGGATP